MPTTTPTPVQLVRFLERIHAKNPQARRIGIRYDGTWPGPARVEVKGQPFRVEACGSALALREVLAEAQEDERIVFLTDREERDLGSDVLVRLARRRLLTVDPWIVLGSLFGAASLEPRLARERWLAEALLAAAPQEGYPAVATGYLTFDAAWDVFAKVVLGLPGGRPDLRDTLSWGSQPEKTKAFREGPPEMKAAVRARLGESAGPAAGYVLAAVEAGKVDPVALGLVCAVLKHPENGRSGELKAAFVRLEPLVGGQQMSTTLALRLGEDAESVVRDLFRQEKFFGTRPVLDRADALLAEVKGESGAVVSDFLPSGFDQRLKKLGHALREVLKGKAGASSLEAPAKRADEHVFARRSPERLEAARMSVRLGRWLEAASRRQAEPTAFADLAAEYAGEGSWVDWARERLGVAEPVKELATAYRELHAAVTARREAGNERFARALVEWGGHALPASGILPVERVLSDVVAPLAKKEPVLLLVLDGMSQAVFLQLLADASERHGWFELGAEGVGRRRLAVAALPTVTDVSRASLLTGTVRAGTSADEKEGFRTHAALVSACRPGRPPVLFHKGEIGAGTYGLVDEVAAAIALRDNRVVGVVLNAVDDHLDKGDQIRPRWTLEYVPLLQGLLDAAESAKRVVVVTADHGHVVERETQLRTHAEAGERNRPPLTPAGEGEVLAEGPRVVAPGKKVVLAWSETVRYAGKKNGYHGGASPQEALVPVAVLTRHEPLPEGWSALPETTPDWWEARPGEPSVPAAAPAAQQGALFGPHAEKRRSVVPTLLAAEVFKERLADVRRQGLTADLAAKALSALEERGGTMTRGALAKELAMPELRIPGLVSALRRVVNVEGYAVLSTDEAGGTVNLNLDLLVTQFDL